MSHSKLSFALFISLAFSSLFACASSDQNDKANAAPQNTTATDTAVSTPMASDSGSTSDRTTMTSSTTTTEKKADNTGVNARDRNGTSPTADQQAGETRSDVELTRQIRRELVKDDSLSSNAKNVKIITKNGVVSLRGPVASSAERAKIASIAGSLAGDTKVRNQLEVKR